MCTYKNCVINIIIILNLYQIDVVNAEGKRLMHTAIIEGFKPMVELLLKHKSNLESEVFILPNIPY